MSNISIIGVGTNALFDEIGIHVRDASNIIIQNVHIRNVKKSGSPVSNGGDAIGMETNVNRVWIDHNWLEASGGEKDGYDSLLDMKAGVTNVTVSYNLYNDSSRAGLIGSSDSDDANTNITFHHNWYKNIEQRTPLIRHALVHMYNNYWSNPVQEYMFHAINSRMNAKVLVESNYMYNVNNPLIASDDSPEPGCWQTNNDNTVLPSIYYSRTVGAGALVVPTVVNGQLQSNCVVTVPYTVAMDAAADVPAIVMANVGVGKISGGGSVSSANSSASSSSVSVVSSSSAAPVSSASASSTAVLSGVINETFSVPKATLFSAGYQAISTDATAARYFVTGGDTGITITNDQLSIVGGRLTIGHRPPRAATTATDTSANGDFDLSRPYRITFTVVSASGAGKVQVYVDNNTTTAANSLHGANSKIYEAVASTLTAGQVVQIDSSRGTATSFIALRAESTATIVIDNLQVVYTGAATSSASSNSSAAVSSVASSAVNSSVVSSSAANSSVASSVVASSSVASSVASTGDRGIISTTACTSVALAYPDAATLTGASTPLQTALYGVRNYSAPAVVGGLHDPANYRAAPVLPTWSFATVDPSHGVLTALECALADENGWAVYRRDGSATNNTRVSVTGGRNAAANRIYTVFNGQQLVNAINEAGLEPKIIRVVGHIDLRYSNNNTVFKEYTSYSDQKYGGSINIPSNTTLVGINGADGKPARMTGTSILIGGELGTDTLAAEEGFKAWIAAGKDGDLYPTWTRNVIIRNLSIDTPWDVNPEDSANAYADGMTLSRAQNIAIENITMSDGDTPDSLASDTRHDGALDVVRGSDYVTIANSRFTKHHKTTLVGNGDSGRAWSDDGRLHVTFANNWWDSVGARLPLNRFGQVHMYNNLISGATEGASADLKFESGTDARYQSNMLVENMAFNINGLKVEDFCGKAQKGKDYKGFRATQHAYTSDRSGSTTVDGQCGFTKPTGADLWLPPYSYSLQVAASVEASVKATAGAGK